MPPSYSFSLVAVPLLELHDLCAPWPGGDHTSRQSTSAGQRSLLRARRLSLSHPRLRPDRVPRSVLRHACALPPDRTGL